MPTAKFYIATDGDGLYSQDGITWDTWHPPDVPDVARSGPPDDFTESTPRYPGPEESYWGTWRGMLYADSTAMASEPELRHAFPPGSNFNEHNIRAIHVSQADPNILTVSQDIGKIWHSTDAGVTWINALNVVGPSPDFSPMKVYRIEQAASGVYYGRIDNPLDPSPFNQSLWVTFGSDLTSWAPVVDPPQEFDVNDVLILPGPTHQVFSHFSNGWDAGVAGAYASLNVKQYQPFRGGWLVTYDQEIDDARAHQTPPYVAVDYVSFHTEPYPGPRSGVDPTANEMRLQMTGGIPINYPSGAERTPHVYGMFVSAQVASTEIANREGFDAEPLPGPVRVRTVPLQSPPTTSVEYLSVPWQGGMVEGLGFGFTSEEEAIAQFQVAWNYLGGPLAYKWHIRGSGSEEVEDPTYVLGSPSAPSTNMFAVLSSTQGMYGISPSAGFDTTPRFWTWGTVLSQLPAPTYEPADDPPFSFNLIGEDPGAPGTFYFVAESNYTRAIGYTDDGFQTVKRLMPDPIDVLYNANVNQLGIGSGVPSGLMFASVQMG